MTAQESVQYRKTVLKYVHTCFVQSWPSPLATVFRYSASTETCSG